MENSIIITTEEFLIDMYGSLYVPIIFNVKKITWWEKPQSYLTAKKTLRWRNSLKEDICFIVNSGGSKNEQITVIRAAFIDWDCGRDENDNYFPIEIVRIKKQEFLAKIFSSPLKPSYIIETRNGYHVYWILTDNPSKDQYITLQKRLICYFNSDPSVKKPAQVMRLPNYNWCKNSCEPFFVYIFYRSDLKYSSSSLLSSFPPIPDSNIDTLSHNNISNSLSSGEKEYTSDKTLNPVSETNTPVEPLEKGISGIDPDNREPRFGAQVNINNNKEYTGSFYLGPFPPFPQEPVLVDTFGEGVDYIKKQNMAEYLCKMKVVPLEESQYKNKNNVTIHCPFHDDTTPSANIYRWDETGYYYLICHSKECRYGPATIIDLVQKLKGMSRYDAVKLLIHQYNIKIDDKWKNEYKETLKKNIQIIEHIEDCKDKYPDLYRCIHRVKGDLVSKLRLAQERTALKSRTGEPMFICSLDEYERTRAPLIESKSYGHQNEKVDRYCLLGLMKKLPDSEIDNGVLSIAYHKRDMKKKNRKTDNLSRVQMYSIPEYTEELLKEADNTAALMKKHSVRMNSISYDLIADIFGEEKAKNIYPQKNTEGITQSGIQFQNQVESILLDDLDRKGYSKIIDIVDTLKVRFDRGNDTDRRVKKYVPGLLVKHGLVEVYCSKELKKQLNIDCVGYPRIIVRKQGMERSETTVLQTMNSTQ